MVDHPLPAQTRAEDERVLLARVGFLRALLPDPRVDAFLTETDRATGLLAAADRYAPLAAALATRIGFRHRSDLWFSSPAEVATAIDGVPPTAEYAALVTDTQSAQREAMLAYVNLDAPIVAAALEMFVRELRCPWRWLALTLAELYVALFWSRCYGRRVELDLAVTIALGPGVTLQPRPGEDPVAAYHRGFTALAGAAKTYLTTQRRAKQAGPKTDGQHVERWADAFYRRDVKAPADTLYRIAKEQGTTPSNIKRGIAKVKLLLDLERLPG